MFSAALHEFGIPHGTTNRAVEAHGALWGPLITGETSRVAAFLRPYHTTSAVFRYHSITLVTLIA
jgi:hypothetical protein